jgi:hypothetical protein
MAGMAGMEGSSGRDKNRSDKGTETSSGELQYRDASGRSLKVRKLSDVLPYIFTALILYGLWSIGSQALLILDRHFQELRQASSAEHYGILEQIRLANYFLDKLVPQQYRVPLELPSSIRDRQQEPRGLPLRQESAPLLPLPRGSAYPAAAEEMPQRAP